MKRDYLKHLGFNTSTNNNQMSKLSQETHARIEADALRHGEEEHGWDEMSKDYLEGALHEAGKVQPIIDAMEELLELLPSGNALNHYFAKDAVTKVREELAKYKEVGNG